MANKKRRISKFYREREFEGLYRYGPPNPLFLLSFSLLLVFSCALNDRTSVPAPNVPVSEVYPSGIDAPVATLDELSGINQLRQAAPGNDTNAVSEYVDWRIARAFALIELEGFKANPLPGSGLDWSTAKLSETPVVVYNALSCPKYYEFQVLKGGTPAGVISCTARKRDGGPVVSVHPLRRAYPDAVKTGGKVKVMSAAYPKLTYGRPGNPGARANVETNVPSPEADTLDLALTRPELFTNVSNTIAAVTEAAETLIRTNLAFWNYVEEHKAQILEYYTNDAYFEMSGRNRAAANGRKHVSDFNGGRALIDQVHTAGWWHKTNVAAILNWGTSPTYLKYASCGPTAVGAVLSWYGLTNMVSCYWESGSYFSNAAPVYERWTNIAVSPGQVYYLSPSPTNRSFTFIISNDVSNRILVQNAYPSGCFNDGAPGVAFSNYLYSWGYKVIVTITNHNYPMTINLNLLLYYADDVKRWGTIQIRRQDAGFVFNAPALITLPIGLYHWQYFYDGYANLGYNMGLNTVTPYMDWVSDTANWTNGSTSGAGVVKAMRWASGGVLNFESYNLGVIFETGWDDCSMYYDQAAASIENNDPFFLSRHDWKLLGELPPTGHWRYGIGYKTVRHAVQNYFLWWSYISYEDWKYFLLTDGTDYESSKKDWFYPNQERMYISPDIWWENTHIPGNNFKQIVFRKR